MNFLPIIAVAVVALSLLAALVVIGGSNKKPKARNLGDAFPSFATDHLTATRNDW